MSGTSERDIQNAVRLAASQRGYTLWRNNTGTAWAGDAKRQPDGSMLIRNPRPLHAGLCVGSSDLVGFRPRLITLADVGGTLAQFVAVEVKAAKGRVTGPQQNFLDHARANGGVGIVARGPGDLP